MKSSELLTRLLIGAGLLVIIVLPLALWVRTPLIHARIAEQGGWSPDVIRAAVGEPLHLKFTSDDVMHGFAVGQMNMSPLDIEPGKPSEITLTFDHPGTYTFYCTRWCGLNHWRMRGTIEVTGAPSTSGPAAVPLYVKLGLNLDEPHLAGSLPSARPSASRGLALLPALSVDTSAGYYRSHSPAQVFAALESSRLSDFQRWDAVAALWAQNTTSASLAEGGRIFAQNCAACHGEKGGGDGVFASDLSAAGTASMQGMNGSADMSMQSPANFSDPRRMLGASPALLQGKILRGGMGTGMPMWGSIFTYEQIWNVVAFIYSFQYDYSN